MVRRPLRPSFSYGDKVLLLENMGAVRHLAIMWGSAADYGSNQHRLAENLQNAVDAMATALTGDIAFYHAKAAWALTASGQPLAKVKLVQRACPRHYLCPVELG